MVDDVTITSNNGAKPLSFDRSSAGALRLLKVYCYFESS